MTNTIDCDFVVIGSGPAGQKAAIQGAKAGRRVVLIERDRVIGGACVHSGTIPSKSLREAALRRSATSSTGMRELLVDVRTTVDAHDAYMTRQLERNGIAIVRGRARFANAFAIDVLHRDGSHSSVTAPRLLVATGSRPRAPTGLTIDHEHILDSDSILSLDYVPRSLLVLGGGVIASEYASIFATLGCRVVQADRAAQPLSFVDAELSRHYAEHLDANGSTFLGGHTIESLDWDGVGSVNASFSNGARVSADKALVALGRTANVDGLGIENLPLAQSPRGDLLVDHEFRTSQPHIFAAGDVIGPPALASSAMEQGRRAACHALGLEVAPEPVSRVPSGIYTIPEIAMVGLDTAGVVERCGGALVGRASFAEIARGHISGARDGLLKLIADPNGEHVLGVHIVGAGATELVHIGQMGLAAHARVDTYVDNVFNFPTLAEAYRVAALDIVRQRDAPSLLRRNRPIDAHA
jgi:NAD(P) transhydrogenase